MHLNTFHELWKDQSIIVWKHNDFHPRVYIVDLTQESAARREEFT